jgi:hypothetical protein
MKVGMLWFDNDPKAGLDIKIERAADYYRVKYGKAPTVCFVHPSMLPAGGTAQPAEEPVPVEGLKGTGIEVRPTRSVLPNHFWIGVNNSAA